MKNRKEAVSIETKSKQYTVYRHTVPANNKVYIGITCQNPTKRWQRGYGYAGSMFFNAVKKYGWDNIKHEILYTNLTRDEAKEKEISLISLYNSTDREYGYNLAKGGLSGSPGCTASNEKKRLLRELYRGHKSSNAVSVICVETEEYFKDMKSVRDKFGIGQKKLFSCLEYSNVDFNGYHFKYADKPNYVKVIRVKQKRVLSEKQKDVCAHLNDSNKIPVVCLDTGKTFESVAEASRFYGVKRDSIRKCLKREHFTAGGLHFDYLDESKRLPPKVAETYENNEVMRKNIETLARLKFKPVVVRRIDGEFVGKFESIKSASKQLNINKSHIGECCRGKLKQTRGYIFEYAKEVS